MPRKAMQDGIEGVVKAQISIKGGVIQDVTILSGPRVFHAAVKSAMLQYKCVTDGTEVVATQEFNFKLE
jgi:protein TonB